MRTSFYAVPALVLLALGGCGESESTSEAPANQAEAVNSTEAELEALTEGQRNAVFIRAIRDADLDCQHVESSERSGDHEGMPVWRAQCAGGSSYSIVITSGGIAQVLDDSQVQLVGNATEPAGNAQ